MDDHIDSENPPQMNRPKQLQIHSVPIYDVENTNDSNKRRTSRGLFPEEENGCR